MHWYMYVLFGTCHNYTRPWVAGEHGLTRGSSPLMCGSSLLLLLVLGIIDQYSLTSLMNIAWHLAILVWQRSEVKENSKFEKLLNVGPLSMGNQNLDFTD